MALIHIPTNIYFENRKQAQKLLGLGRYKRLAEKGQFKYLNKEDNNN